MDVDRRDLQGNIFRSYGDAFGFVRHLVLRVVEPAAARAALAAMVDGDRSTPEITPADRHPREAGDQWCLNVGFTWRGLQALGLPGSSLETFPPEFREGMVARAARLGDVGASSPQHWIAGLWDTENVHLVITVHGREAASLGEISAKVLAAQDGRAFAALSGEMLDGAVFTDGHHRKVHFGYVDGISQPRFEGIHREGPVPGQPFTPLGAILLGHPAPLPAIRWRVPHPPDELGQNGTFNAFRVLGQDVVGFETFLGDSAARLGCTAEEVAAKLCGRWRKNGAPLVLAPTEADSAHFPDEDLNRFGYMDDADGSKCPIGSHIRRTNPRDARIVQRGTNDVRGLLRRGMPFGPRYDPERPDGPQVPRGLLGNFICASLAAQFEPMQADWLNLGLLDPRITGTHDPLVGANDERAGGFRFTTAAGDPVTLEGVPRFVRTLGGAYLFLPTVPAVTWMARAAWR